ncbi:MAG: BatD family protein [Halioglobus sp.]
MTANSIGRFTGSHRWRVRPALLMLFLLLTARPGAWADVTAIVDRHQVALGDSFRLIITSTEGEDLDDIEFGELEKHFDILQRSSSNKMSIVNGSRSHTKQLQLDLAPRAEGSLRIPPLRVDGEVTPGITIRVKPQPDIETHEQVVVFEAEVDKDSVYVQEQLILTLRVLRAINLEDPSLAPVELEDAFVKPLQQQSFQRNIDGRLWLVHEMRYAIFPEHSGRFEIPPQLFTARESVGRRSLFDLRSGRSLRRTSRPIEIEVLPRPREFPSSNWLPARSLIIEEQWSAPPEQLREGESVTRTIRLQGEGLQGAQLPPVLFQPVDGLKFYPDQPEITEQEVSTGLLGMRRDSAAIVPTRAGTVSLPEIRIPWWDSQSETVRYAVLPAREIDIAAAATPAASEAQPTAISNTAEAALTNAPQQSTSSLWQVVALFSSVGWLLTVAYLLWSRSGSERGSSPLGSNENTSERRAFKAVEAACAANQPLAARQALISWGRACTGDDGVTSLAQVVAHYSDGELKKQVALLDGAIYGARGGETDGGGEKDGGPGQWRGEALAACVSRLRKAGSRAANDDSTLRLYPESTAQDR